MLPDRHEPGQLRERPVRRFLAAVDASSPPGMRGCGIECGGREALRRGRGEVARDVCEQARPFTPRTRRHVSGGADDLLWNLDFYDELRFKTFLANENLENPRTVHATRATRADWGPVLPVGLARRGAVGRLARDAAGREPMIRVANPPRSESGRVRDPGL